MTSISIQIQSVGFSFGNCASITINGSDVAPGQYQRGLNVAVADQSTGALRWFHNYDTNASSEAAGAGGEAVVVAAALHFFVDSRSD